MNLKISKLPILIIDDDEKFIKLYKDAFEYHKIPALYAMNGSEGLELCNKYDISIFVVDLNMSVMDGKTFISHLKKNITDAMIIVQTGMNDSETIIDTMKLGIFDYIVKPFRISAMIATVEKALEHKYFLELEKEQNKNVSFKLKAQLEWLNYKEVRRIKDKDMENIQNLYHLHSSLFQGGGIGTIMSLIEMLKDFSEISGENVILNKETFDLLVDSHDLIKSQIQSIYNSVQVIDKKTEFEIINISTFANQISIILSKFKSLLADKNIKISYPKVTTNTYINIDTNLIGDCIEELVLNACKYCAINSTINILVFITEGYLNITVKNSMQNGIVGIPVDKEKIALEPFVRFHPPIETLSGIEKYGVGLGLTVVDNIAKKHNGFFTIHDAIDHTNSEFTNCTLAELFLPLPTSS